MTCLSSFGSVLPKPCHPHPAGMGIPALQSLRVLCVFAVLLELTTNSLPYQPPTHSLPLANSTVLSSVQFVPYVPYDRRTAIRSLGHTWSFSGRPRDLSCTP